MRVGGWMVQAHERMRDVTATHTAQRIRKLLRQGLAPESIARKIGRPGPEGVARVRLELARMGQETGRESETCESNFARCECDGRS